MRIPPLPRRARLWLVWLLLAFGVMNVFGPPIEAWRRPDDAGLVDWKTLRARQTPVERLMTTLRDDGDVERYFAYAEATLGRPYVATFVRPPGEAGPEGPPDLSRIIAPARRLVPWRDFAVEYPPGMMAAALLPALATRDENTYVRLFALEMESALTLAVWLAARTADRLKPGAGETAIAHAALLTAALGVIAVRRYDPMVALAVAAAVHALGARRPAVSGAALGLGVALKGVPILLAPIFVLHALRTVAEGPRRPLLLWLAGFAAALGVSALAYGALAGPHALDAFAYHGRRPMQVETIYSGLLILVRNFAPSLMSEAFAYGSLNVVSPAEPALRALSSALLLAGIGASWVFAAVRLAAAPDERGRLIALVQASLACLVADITLGKVFSPQYCVWLVPLAATLAPFATRAARRLLPAAFLIVQAEYPFLYGFLYSTLVPTTGALIAFRTVWLWRYAGAITTPCAPSVASVERGGATHDRVSAERCGAAVASRHTTPVLRRARAGWRSREG